MARRTLVTRGPWSYSTTSGYGIEGYCINAYRWPARAMTDYMGPMLSGTLQGRVVATSAEADALGLLHGYLQPYSRNMGRFVASRASKRRGIVAQDYVYESRRAYWMAEMQRRELAEAAPRGWDHV